MASRRKAEGIALLAVYGGDEDDDAGSQGSGDEENEVEEDVGSIGRDGGQQAEEIGQVAVVDGLKNSTSPREADGSNSGVPAAVAVHSRRATRPAGALGIVDYGPEEGLALSPEIEGDTSLDAETSSEDGGVQADDGPARESPLDAATPRSRNVIAQQSENVVDGSAHLSAEAADVEDKVGGTAEVQEVSAPEPMEIDMLADFLPPAPLERCSSELQDKISYYLTLKSNGSSLNENLRKSKGYRNPDFLQSAVRHYDIDHIGSCFSKEIFDPHGYHQADYYDSIALEIRREAERKDQERRQSQRVDFVRTSLQAAVTKPILPLGQKVVSVTTSETQVVRLDGRASKRSKWDKVEVGVGRSSQVISHTADAIASMNAQAALLTASANAGAGYATFAQQQRREADKMRANEISSSNADNSREKRKKLGS